MLLEVRCYVKPWSGWGALLGLRCFGHWLRLGGALLLWCGRGAACDALHGRGTTGVPLISLNVCMLGCRGSTVFSNSAAWSGND